MTESLSPAIGAASSGGGAGGVVVGTVANAVVGGTVSELSGGKFGNGAQTGAFQYLFNQVVHGGNNPRDWTDEQWNEWRRRDSLDFLYWAAWKPVETAGIFLMGFGAGGLLERGALWVASTNSATKLRTVTPWADEGITPDLTSGRWVQIGNATIVNFLKTGLPGPKLYLNPLKLQNSKVPFSNSITGQVPASAFKFPSGLERWKALLGQRQIKADS